jgi:hypothetical protein
MKKIGQLLGLTFAMAGMHLHGGALGHTNRQSVSELVNKKKGKAIPPAGTKPYFFDADGNFSNTAMKKGECVFDCFAINESNARRKFEKWKSI